MSPILAAAIRGVLVLIVEILVFLVEVIVLILIDVFVLVFVLVLKLLLFFFIVELFVERLTRAVAGLLSARRADTILDRCAARVAGGAST
jgi:hypothetical protein